MMRALSMEEGNIEEHKNYLTLEEEKRRKARVVRASVQGPLIRWVSKKEEVTMLVQVPPPTPPPAIPNPYIPYHYPPTASPVTPAPSSHTPTQHSNTPALHPSQYTSMASQPSQFQQWPPSTQDLPSQYQPPTPVSPPASATPALSSAVYAPAASHPHTTTSSAPIYPGASPYTPSTTTAPTYTPVSAQPLIPGQSHVQTTASTLTLEPSLTRVTQPFSEMLPPSQPIERQETVAKQYVIHEISQSEKARPSWHSTMTAMFGDHTDWENCRVYTTKGRPFGTSIRRCRTHYVRFLTELFL